MSEAISREAVQKGINHSESVYNKLLSAYGSGDILAFDDSKRWMIKLLEDMEARIKQDLYNINIKIRKAQQGK